MWGRVRGRVRGGHSWSRSKACGGRGRLGWSGVGWVSLVFPVIEESHLHTVAKINLGYFWPFLIIIDNGYYLVISPLCPYSFKLVLLEF